MENSRLRRANVTGGAVLGSLFLFALGTLGIWYGSHQNREYWMLTKHGDRTLGILEKVTRTRTLLWGIIPLGSDYSFDISFADKAGSVQHLHSAVSGKVLKLHTRDNDTYTHHPIEVVFLRSDPNVAGLPAMLGPSIVPFFIGGFFVWLGISNIRQAAGFARRTPRFTRHSIRENLFGFGARIRNWIRLSRLHRSGPQAPPGLDEERTIWITERQLGEIRTLRHRGRKVQYRLPKDIGRQITLRFKGYGKPRAGEVGDLMVHVRVDRGEDVESPLWISEGQARAGATKGIACDTGTVAITVPSGSVGGQILRLHGCGRRSPYRWGLPVFMRKRGDLLVRLRVFSDCISPIYRPVDTLGIDELALEGWVYRRSDEILKKLRSSPLSLPPFTATRVADLFNEKGWRAIGWSLADRLRVRYPPVSFEQSASLPAPGICRTVTENHSVSRFEIMIRSDFLEDPFAVTAILAHELCHIVEATCLAQRDIAVELKGGALMEVERTVDLLVFLFQLGEFQMRVARHSRMTLGYFNQELFERMYVIASRKQRAHGR
jgi:hypothetical protein